MQKDFDSWNKKKKQIDEKEERLFFRTGEIWWVNKRLINKVGHLEAGKLVEINKKISRVNFG